MGSILPLHPLVIHQPEVSFIHESRGLQTVARSLSLHVSLRETMQFLINDGREFIQCRLIPVTPRPEQKADIPAGVRLVNHVLELYPLSNDPSDGCFAPFTTGGIHMKPIYLAAATLLASVAMAQSNSGYIITDLGTLGGTYSYAYGGNEAGQVAGGAATKRQTDGVAQTAFLWSRGHIINLGTLEGSDCPDCSSEGAAVSGDGAVAVISEISKKDPDGEDFCSFGTHLQCIAAIWRRSTMTALPTLPGGRNSQVFWMNSEGEAVGFSETAVRDSTCKMPFQVFRYEAVKWSRDGKIQELRPLSGDTVSFAFANNDKGEVVGVSGTCANVTLPPSPSGPHGVIWDKDGNPTDLGTLPGGFVTNASGISNRSEVVGTVKIAEKGPHAFLWTKNSGIQDLGVPEGDSVSIIPCCNSINSRGDIVAFSCPGSREVCRTEIRRDGKWIDLNTLALPGTNLYLNSVANINDSGQIVTGGLNQENDIHAALATPARTRSSIEPMEDAISRSTQLDGSQSTSADGKDLSYVWSIPQGFPSAAILGGNTATPTVQFSLTRGIYAFQLTVTDSTGATSTDTVMVNYQGN